MSATSQIKVSVIIPTFDRANFLREAIDSVLNQTEKNFELIVVDDGSRDDTSSVVRSFSDTRIKYFFTERKGVSAARNLGVKNSSADIIAFLDSDDLWLPKKLSTQLDFFSKLLRPAICQTEEIWVRKGVRVNPHKKHKKQSGWIFEHCLPLCIISPSAVMMTRAVFDELGGFDESFPACEDYDLWLRAALRYEVFTMPDALIVKRGGHEDQLSGAWGLDLYRIKALVKISKDKMCDGKNLELVQNELARRIEILRSGAAKRNNVELIKELETLLG